MSMEDHEADGLESDIWPEKSPAPAIEKRLLGQILRWPPALDEVAARINVDHFYVDAHQRIFRAMIALWEKGQAVDMAGVATLLGENGELNDVGGAPYIYELFESETAGFNAKYLADVVRQHSLRRKLFYVGSGIAKRANDYSSPADEMLEQAEKDVFELGEIAAGTDDVADFGQVVSEACDAIDERCLRGGGIQGVTTGFYDLDDLTGGMARGSLVILAARPSIGKTAFAMAMALAASKAGIVPHFVSLEQKRSELGERMLCAEGLVNSQSVRLGRLKPEASEQLAEARRRITDLKGCIDDVSPQTCVRIAANARRLKRQRNIGIVFIDYLQLVEPENKKTNRQEQIAAMTRRLKMIAREVNVPIVCLAQLNRAVEMRAGGVPVLSDLRESGAIEQDADQVMFLHKSEDAVAELEIIVAKNRNGMTGARKLTFRKEFLRFDNHAVEQTFG